MNFNLSPSQLYLQRAYLALPITFLYEDSPVLCCIFWLLNPAILLVGSHCRMAEEIIPTILRCIKGLFLPILRRLIFRKCFAVAGTAGRRPEQEFRGKDIPEVRAVRRMGK